MTTENLNPYKAEFLLPDLDSRPEFCDEFSNVVRKPPIDICFKMDLLAALSKEGGLAAGQTAPNTPTGSDMAA